MEIVVGRS